MRTNHAAVDGEEEIRPASASPPCVAASADGGGGKKKKGSSWGLKRMIMKVSKDSLTRRWKKYLTSAFRWKRADLLQVSLVDDVLFKVVSALEAVVLVAAVSFFYLCCGCHF